MTYPVAQKPSGFLRLSRFVAPTALALLSFGFVLLLADPPAMAQAADPQAAIIGSNPQILLRNALEWVNGLGAVGAIAQRTLQHSIVSKISGAPKVLFILVQ
jgi:hypothetical protein